MKIFKEKQFTTRYNKIMFFTFSVVLIISAGLLTITTYSQTKHDNAQLIEQFKTKSIAIDNLIDSITEHLILMKAKAEAYELDPKQENSILFEALSNTNEDSYSLDNIPYPYTEKCSGNLTGSGKISDMSQSLRQEIEMSLSLNSLFQASKTNIPNAAWVYYTSKNKFINIYPWTHSGNFRFSEELFSHEFFQLGLPKVNPDKQLFWTSAYIDEYGKGMMVTAANPIYIAEKFVGTIAIDITLDKLTEYVQHFRNPSDILMILNEKDQLIAHPTLTSSKNTGIQSFKIGIPEPLKPEAENIFTYDQLKLKRIGMYLLIWSEMKNASWRIVFISKEPSFFIRVFSKIGIVFLILMACLCFMLYSIEMITFREFIHPAENLVRHISMESENKPAPIPHVPEQWLPWFEEISLTFAQNRNLIEEIKEKNILLTDMNISLERYMPKFILMISVADCCGSTTIGNYFASILSRKDSTKTTAYLEFPVPEKISTDLGLENIQDIYQHPNGYDIWVSDNLGIVPKDARTSLLMTRILNNYNNIVINAVARSSVDEFINNSIEPMFRYAKAIVLMAPPDDISHEKTVKAAQIIRKHVRQDQTNVYIVLNRVNSTIEYTDTFDFEIPFLPNHINLSREKFDVPDQALSVVSKLVDRVERVHQISAFIPGTVDVDKPIDTKEYVKKTMEYFGATFGGATSSQAQGVWNSDTSGIVNEAVHIVISYVTEDDLSRYLDEVIEFIKKIKNELHQEAMAIEINKKLVLI